MHIINVLRREYIVFSSIPIELHINLFITGKVNIITIVKFISVGFNSDKIS